MLATPLSLVFAGLLLMGLPAHAAMSDASPGDPPWLTAARTDLKAERFEQVVTTLRAANAADSAEWHNLLGYALRKKTPPDLAAAETHYKRALEIDPKHRHAMEYYGELFLMKGNLAGAEAMLARLNARVITEVANDDARPAWHPGNFFGETFATPAKAPPAPAP